MIKRGLNFPAVGLETFFLWGPHQTGKSTLPKEQYPDSVLVDLL